MAQQEHPQTVIRNREAGAIPTLLALSLFGCMIFVFVAAMA